MNVFCMKPASSKICTFYRRYYFRYSFQPMQQSSKLMKAIIIQGPEKITLQQIPIPKPQDGEVLIKVMAAPINPSDVYFLKSATYSTVKKAPCVAGFQGSGVVIENGGGIVGWGLVNKKVAFTPLMSSGSYAQYALAKSSQCLPVDDKMSFEHASMSFVNPLTAMAMLDIAESKKIKTVIVNAAASSLGRMLNRFLPPEGVQIINIVRREQQVELLKKEGANHILNSSDADFEQKLKELALKMNALICYDAIGGSMTGTILKCMPNKSILYIYGLLSGEHMNNIDTGDMLYGHKTITGLFLPNWMQEKGFVKLVPTIYKLRKLLLNELKSEIAVECPLEQLQSNLKLYVSNMTKGKVIIKPFMEHIPKQQQKNE